MRTLALLLLCPLLAGCEAMANIDPTITGSAATATSVEAPKPKPTAQKPEDFICPWALAAGVGDLNVSRFDSGDTKRKVASTLGAYKVTCPEQVKNAGQPAPVAAPAPKKG